MIPETNPLFNTVRAEDVYNDIKSTLKDSRDFLKQFCGPYALFAGTVSVGTSQALDDFTKDGVTIYSHLSARSHVDETTRRLIEFIGKRVDKRCHDGTTTSMMTASTLGYHWMEALAPKTRRERHLLAKDITRVLEQFNKSIDKYGFTVDELIAEVHKVKPDIDADDIRKKIFYDAIMTSSKGDSELADKLSEVLLSMPKELYGYARFEQSFLETDTRFEMSQQDCNITITGSEFAGNPSLLPGNKLMGTKYDISDCNLIVCGNQILDGQAESLFLEQTIINKYCLYKEKVEKEITVVGSNGKPVLDENGEPEKAISIVEEDRPAPETLDKPLVILAPLFNANIIRTVNYYNEQQSDWRKKIFLMRFSFPAGPRSNMAFARTVAYMADGNKNTLTEAINTFDLTTAFIPCDFEYVGTRIEISNLYKKDGRKFHPYYYDDTKERYHALVNEMRETVEENHKAHVDANKRLESFAYDLVYFQRCLMCQNIIEMKVCGTTHELISNMSVVEDALGSALSVAEDGVILSGYQKILYDLQQLPEDTPIMSASSQALAEVICAAYDITSDEYNQYAPSLVGFDNAEDVKFLYNNAFDEAPFKPRNLIDELVNGGESKAILQPRIGYTEQFKRIGDIITKLVMTYAVLTERKFNPQFGR